MGYDALPLRVNAIRSRFFFSEEKDNLIEKKRNFLADLVRCSKGLKLKDGKDMAITRNF